MRRRPFGKLLPSAHAVDREFRVISALGKQPGFPVARAYALCMDDAVIGSAFYIMSMEEGRVFWDPGLPSQTPESRRKIFTSKIETLAKLHTFDPEKIGLGDFGKPGNYFARRHARSVRALARKRQITARLRKGLPLQGSSLPSPGFPHSVRPPVQTGSSRPSAKATD